MTPRDNFQGFNPADRKPQNFIKPQPSIIDRLSLHTGIVAVDVQPSILIVDISHWNGVIDWRMLRESDVQAVIMKCSEGAENTYYEYKDVNFEDNWRGALDHDFPVMLYHFFRGERGSAEKSWFMKCADAFLNDTRINGKTAAWLDCEWKRQSQSMASYTNRAFNFCDLIMGEGIRQGVYSSPGLVPQLFDPAQDHRWANVYQWNAHWTRLLKDTLPRGWSEILRLIWQFGISPTHDWTPVVNGAGTVDVNHGYWASVMHLREWLGIAVASPSPSPSPSPSTPPPSDCCEDHELRIRTLEAGQQVLTEVQQLQEYAIGQLRLDLNLLDTSVQSLGERVDQIHGNQTSMAVTLTEHEQRLERISEVGYDLAKLVEKNDHRLAVVEANYLPMYEVYQKIKAAFCPPE